MENNVIYEHFNLSEFKNLNNLNEIRDLNEKVNSLYFTDYSKDRSENLKKIIFDLIKIIDDNLQNSNILTKNEIAFLYFTKSLCLDKLPEYSKIAEESASKSLKLNPFNADNYNCIAHILWKKKDLENATSYFLKALEIDPKNKTSLRCLSMIVRSKDFTSDTEKSEAAKKSLEYAKKAVELDLKDSESWYVYGNAYFYLAFFETNQYENLKNSLNSYTQSEKSLKMYKNPDLYYNRGVVHSYLENYKEAYNDFLGANSIDSNLKGDELAQNIMNTFIQTVKFVKNQCSLKNKKLTQLLNSIPKNLKEENNFLLTSINDFIDAEGNFNKSISVKNRLISAKIIQPVSKVFEVPLSVICLDHDGRFFCLSFYNVGKTFLETIKFAVSNVVIIEPNFKIFKFEINNKVYEYPCIQVSNLSKVLIDGKYLMNFASSALVNSKFFN